MKTNTTTGQRGPEIRQRVKSTKGWVALLVLLAVGLGGCADPYYAGYPRHGGYYASARPYGYGYGSSGYGYGPYGYGYGPYGYGYGGYNRYPYYGSPYGYGGASFVIRSDRYRDRYGRWHHRDRSEPRRQTRDDRRTPPRKALRPGDRNTSQSPITQPAQQP